MNARAMQLTDARPHTWRADAEQGNALLRERHRCEVRHCIGLGLQGGGALDRYLELVGKARGKAAAAHLLDDARHQYFRGNRGSKGCWK
jgi:hypothetical protein